MAKVTAALVKELREKTGAGMMDCKKALVETEGDVDKAIDVLREKGLSKATKKADRIAAEGLVRIAMNDDHSKAAVIEVNSETDFVAKNQEFIDFVEGLAKLALDSDAKTMDEFMALPFEGEASVNDALTQKIAKIGEKLSIRRFEKLETPGTVYTGYIHGGGTIGAIDGIKTDASYAEIETAGKDVAMQIASMAPKYVTEDEADPAFIENEKEIARQQLLNEGKPEKMIDKIIPGKIKKVMKDVCLVDQKFVKNGDQTVAEYIAETAKALGKDMQLTEMVRYEVGEGIEKRSDDFAAEVAAQQAAAQK
ncbi:MAG: translation elongation factor Ts [Anaerovoracaceae bacterium]|jgi:elongation factor Ts